MKLRHFHCYAVAVFALFVSLATWNRFFPIVGDSTVYIANAVHMVLGGKYQGIAGTPPTWFPPGIGLLIGVLTKFLKDPVLAGRILSLIASTLTAIPLVLISERLFNRRTAIVVGLVYAVNPARLIYAQRVSSEATYLLLILVALLLWLHESDGFRPVRAAVAGAFIGAAYYVRPEALAYLPFMIILSLAFRKWWKIPALKSVLIMCVVAGFLTLPYVHYLRRNGFGWALSGKTVKTVYRDCISLSKNIQYAAVRRLDAKCQKIVMDPVDTTETPRQFIVRTSNNVVNMTGELGGILGPFLSACLVLGLGLELRRGNQTLQNAAPLLLLMCVQLAVLPPFVVFTRFVYLGATPFLIVACWQLLTRFTPQASDRPRPIAHVALWLPVGLLLLQFVATGREVYFGHGKHAEMAMTEMVRQHVPKGVSLLTSRFTVAYLAGDTMLFLPNDSLARVLRYADNHNTKYALITSLDELGKSDAQIKEAESKGLLKLMDSWKGKWEDREDQWARLYRIRGG